MDGLLTVSDFLTKLLEEKILLLDVRSPKEFYQAHIPAAVNMPLLDDEARRLVGITYKQRGREAAVLKGFDLVGKKFGDFIRETKKLTESKQVMLYCWRGGMRSSIMSWVLNMGGFKTFLLKGGYKAFRNHVLQTLEQPRKVIVVGGKTGSGKTELLQHLQQAGEQIICLETFANHRGSAYGGLGLPPQPRNEMFVNMLAMELMKMDSKKILWLENESQNIGAVMLPKKIYELVRTSPMIEIMMSREERIQRILNEYGGFNNEDLIENTERLRKRLGGLSTNNAIEAIQSGDKRSWIEEVLQYYDKTYEYGNEIRNKNSIIKLEIKESESMKEVSKNAIKMAGDILTEKIL